MVTHKNYAPTVGNLLERTDRNGRVIEYEWDNLYRMVEERWKDGQDTVRTLTFSFDAIGRLLEASDPAGTFTYDRDDLGRATSITHALAGVSSAVVISQTFDLRGNRTQLAAQIGSTARRACCACRNVFSAAITLEAPPDLA